MTCSKGKVAKRSFLFQCPRYLTFLFPSQSHSFPSLHSVASRTTAGLERCCLRYWWNSLRAVSDKQSYSLAILHCLIICNSCVQNNGTQNHSEPYQFQIKTASNMKTTIICALTINNIENRLVVLKID